MDLDCGLGNFVCYGQEKFVNGIFGIVEYMAASIADAVGDALFSMGTLWVGIEPPQIVSGERNPSQAAGALEAGPDAAGLEVIASYTMWIGLVVCILSIIILGARLAVVHTQGETRRSIGKMGWVLGAAIIISGAGSLVGALLGRMPLRAGGTTGFLQNSLWWYTLIAAVIGVVIGAIRMAWEQRAEPGKDTLRSIMTLIAVVGAGATVINFGVQAADGFSRWILDNSLVSCKVSDDGCFGGTITQLLGIIAVAGTPSMAIVLVIVLGLIALIVSIIQIILMLARSGILVILTGVLPLSASFTTTEMGRTWFKRTVAWIIAFILYKPVAAIVYAAAIRLISADAFGSGSDEIISVITGILLMILAVVALPALMRLVAPAVASVAGGSGGGVMMAAAGAAAMLPTGAISSGSSQAGSAGSPPAIPSATGAAGTAGASGSSGAATHGASGKAGTQGAQGSGSVGASGGAGASGAAGTSGAVGASGASGAAAAGGGAAAGAAGGPVGMAVATGAQAVQKGVQAAQQSAQALGSELIGDEASGSK